MPSKPGEEENDIEHGGWKHPWFQSKKSCIIFAIVAAFTVLASSGFAFIGFRYFILCQSQGM